MPATFQLAMWCLSSKSKSVSQIEAIADERVRPIISTIPGATTTHPFGGNVRTIVITVNPQRLRALRLEFRRHRQRRNNRQYDYSIWFSESLEIRNELPI
jgi:multidrug efflux pump subunit AcrB